ncbi:YHS domain-containing protein [Balamuthia mandrillaris]
MEAHKHEDGEEQEEEEVVDLRGFAARSHTLANRLKDLGVDSLIGDRKRNLKTHRNVFVGKEFVDWLIEKGEAKTREEAVTMGQDLINCGYVHHVSDSHGFKDDNLFYRFRQGEAKKTKIKQEKRIFKNKKGVAIGGYDCVAYFEQGRALKGTPQLSERWSDAEWWFHSDSNRELFRKDPARYAPQYGGYCAFAVANGSTAATSPEAWKVVEGKLYLNYNKVVRALWNKAEDAVVRGDQHWRTMVGEGAGGCK